MKRSFDFLFNIPSLFHQDDDTKAQEAEYFTPEISKPQNDKPQTTVISTDSPLVPEISQAMELPSGGFRGGEGEIPQGGWRAPSTDVYRSKCGKYYFEFEFHLVGDHYQIDILKMPSYDNRSTDLHLTHRLSSDHGNEYRICFGDNSETNTLVKAKKWASVWSECTIRYIETGKHFPNT